MFLGLIQPDVALTDFFLALETLVLGLIILNLKIKSKIKLTIFLFYISLALSSIIGGIVHGFFPYSDSLTNLVLWKATMICLGLVSLFSWLIAGNLILPKYKKLIQSVASLEFFLYSVYVIFINSQFKIAIYNYVPATIFLLISLCILYLRKKQPSTLLGVIGIILTFIAAWIQQAQISLHQIYFNHNAFYHVVQAIALLLIFFALRKIVLKDKTRR